MVKFIKDVFTPPPAQRLLPQNEQKDAFERYRSEVFFSIFIGYAGYYLVRKNIALVAPNLSSNYNYDMRQIGLMMGAVSFSYGLSKFIMGAISDRSNAKIFLSCGLFLSSTLSLILGLFPDFIFSHFTLLLILMGLNGWFQGMGWPPCGRAMVHWFSHKERGSKMAIWNMAHNIGQAIPALLVSVGITAVLGWQSVIWLPAIAALIISLVIYRYMQDTPQSLGLPTIEAFQKTQPQSSQRLVVLKKEDFYRHVLYNKHLWALAFANLFVYLTRYAIIDWLPMYLVQVRHYTEQKAGLCYSMYELAGIGGTFICGWMSDHVFDGRRAPAGMLFLLIVAVTLSIYWHLPNSYTLAIDTCLFALGFLIYGPVMLIGLHAIDIVPKHVAGTAAGFTGLFGYVGGATCANALFGFIVYYFGWNGGFLLLMLSCFMAIGFLSMTWNARSVSCEKSSLALSPAVITSKTNSQTLQGN